MLFEKRNGLSFFGNFALATICGLVYENGMARAAVTISSKPTANITCVSGVCTPTAKQAALNVDDLTTMLASGNVEINTGSGSLAQQVQNIVVSAPFNWTSASSLTLDAWQSITIKQPIADNGVGSVALTTDDGGSGGVLLFGAMGSLSFVNAANILDINGVSYKLENTLPALASDIAANPAGSYALSGNYNAGGDGTYGQAPVATAFTGNFDGLGHTISNIDVHGTSGSSGGLFAEVGGGIVANIGLTSLNLNSGKSFYAGGLAGSVGGIVIGAHVDGVVVGNPMYGLGGLLGVNAGTIEYSFATASVESHQKCVGGIVGSNEPTGLITQSYATSSVKATAAGEGAGGLVCVNQGVITNSYATGSAQGGISSMVGGLVSSNYNSNGNTTINTSYSTGAVSGRNKNGKKSEVGGFLGFNDANASIADSYWDTTTSGKKKGVGSGSDSGLTGLTTKQLHSGLPAGFDPTIWAEDKKINNGFPYLIANPPPK